MDTIFETRDEWLAESRRTACTTINAGAALLFECWMQELDADERRRLEAALAGGAELGIEIRPALDRQPPRIAFLLVEREGVRRELAHVRFEPSH